MMIPVPKRFIRVVALVGIVVCGAWTIFDMNLGNYRIAGAYAFFTAINAFAYWQNRR